MANPNEIVYTKRNAAGTAFDEKILVPVSNYFVVCGPCGDLTTFTGSMGGGGTSLGTGSTYPFTASWAINAVNAGASLGTGSTYPFTSSWAESSAWASSSLSSSYASSSLSASYALSASWAATASYFQFSSMVDGYFPQWVNNNLSATSSLFYTASTVTMSGSFSSHAYQVTGSIINYILTDYILTNTDNGRLISIASNSPVSLSVSQSLDATFNCMVYQSGSGLITFVSESGLHIRNRSSFYRTAGQYSVATLIRVSNSDFVLAGDLA